MPGYEDWKVKAVASGQGAEGGSHDHEKPRWKTIEIDLAKFVDQKVTLRLEAHSNGWSMKFAYWHWISLE